MMNIIEDALGRHERVALQFSGGRDSLAVLYLMRPYWDRISVYWCNTGDAYPETLSVVDYVRDIVPNFIEIMGRQPQVIAEFGLPSDIVPVSRTPLGLLVSQAKKTLIQDRYSCCARSMMFPTQERMIADGITLIIRGQKNADEFKAATRSGEVHDGIELLYPIENWTARQVMDYLHEQHAPTPRFYEVMDSAPDCMTCSAWWENGAATYLKRYHFEQYQEVQRRLDEINTAVGIHIAAFNKEVSA
jgi:phosphoadenosine phosphosulfate reductase